MHDRALIHLRDGFIRTADILTKLIGGELAHCEHGLELLANVDREILARKHIVDWLAVPQNAAFFVRAARDVASAKQNRREY